MTQERTTETRLIPMREAQRLAGLSRASIRRRILSGDFPRPMKLGNTARSGVRFSLAEVEQWIQRQLAARPATKQRDEAQALAA